MNEIRFAPEPGEEEHKTATVRSALSQRQQMPSRAAPGRRSIRPLSILWLSLAMVLLASVVGLTLIQVRTLPLRQTNPLPTVPSLSPTREETHAQVAFVNATVHLYPVVPADAGLMVPAVDRRGTIWFGEMTTNHLARLDPSTGKVLTWTPPHGEEGIMGITIDTLGNIWFAEQNANYIGRFDPLKQTFRLYPFHSSNGHPVGLQDVQFDASGKLWFTELINGRIGRLDPINGSVQTWSLPALVGGVDSYPFGLTITADEQVWFGTYTGGVVGHLNPVTGQITLYHLMNPHEQVYSMTVDAADRVWFTELQFGKLGMIDPRSGKVLELSVPTVLGNPEDLHTVVAAPDGNVWFTSSGTNALIRYSPLTAKYTFFQLSLPGSNPFGLALDAAGNLWFTAGGGQQANYIGEILHNGNP